MLKKILAVDDDSDILNIIKFILEDEGYQVTTLDNGMEVQRLIANDRPDLILLDVMLGGMDGREVCKSIKNDSNFSQIPVIMISASHNLQSVVKSPGAPDSFLAKPFDMYNLIDLVKLQISAA
ncbi:histidine kinase [Pedobacter antarcticus 4BY]|uniref:Histidine kinase n=2 Tax=Pedobacter antarcticus TaxID=34086 RepID=A0A081PKD3_9SPHI|nr:response regulator [Pedobacter antarcticus]KEQ31156.1 histidine kinase [Pedobacter antarcticus 4BY]SFE53522.1 Response regulator receiver domain-containing protein [Pedobacter antarcticus]